MPCAAALLALSALMTGCADTGYRDAPQGNVGAFDGAVPAGVELSKFLDDAPPDKAGFSTVIAHSPLGPNIVVTSGLRYFSASGNTCMHIHVEGGTSIHDGPERVACRVGVAQQGRSSNWVVQRSVISVHQSEDNNGNPVSIGP